MDNSDVSDASDSKKPLIMLFRMETISMIIVCQTKIEDSNIFDKLCIPCGRSKLIRIVRWNKSIIATSNKLKEIHTNL